MGPFSALWLAGRPLGLAIPPVARELRSGWNPPPRQDADGTSVSHPSCSPKSQTSIPGGSTPSDVGAVQTWLRSLFDPWCSACASTIPTGACDAGLSGAPARRDRVRRGSRPRNPEPGRSVALHHRTQLCSGPDAARECAPRRLRSTRTGTRNRPDDVPQSAVDRAVRAGHSSRPVRVSGMHASTRRGSHPHVVSERVCQQRLPPWAEVA